MLCLCKAQKYSLLLELRSPPPTHTHTHAHTQDADSDGNYDNKLDFEEFCSLFKDLATRPELRRLFNLYSSKKEWVTVEDLQRFLEVEQGNGGDDVIMTSL